MSGSYPSSTLLCAIDDLHRAAAQLAFATALVEAHPSYLTDVLIRTLDDAVSGMERAKARIGKARKEAEQRQADAKEALHV